MASKFYALLTTRGEAKLAQAVALGTQLKITQMAVGDGGGVLPTPNASQTKLVNQVRIAAINTLSVDPVNVSQIIAEQVIPENEGGWWIREIGLFDDAGELIAVANCAETYKPLLAEGSGRTQVIRMIVIVSSTEAVSLKIDPSVVLATRKYVDDKVIEVKAYADSLMKAHTDAADPHPQYAPKANPNFTGVPKAPTPANGNNTTQLATTAFVQAAIGLLKGDAPAALDTLVELAAAINNDPAFYTTMSSQLALKAAIASPTFSGVPKAPTAVAGNNSTQLATTQFVQSAIAALVASSPAALDTLKELADALGNDPNFATTMATQMGLKAPLESPALTGAPTAPTAALNVNNTQIATTAFVLALFKSLLSSDTNSSSELLAATPKAIKAVNDVALKFMGNIASGVDFNTFGPAQAGTWGVTTTAATTNPNIPESAVGYLEVTPYGSYGCTQRYTTRIGMQYVRSLAGAWNGANGPWAAEWSPVGFVGVGNINTADVSTLMSPGKYSCGGTVPGLPIAQAGVLEVERYNNNASTVYQTFKTMVANAAYKNRIFTNTYSSGVWSGWAEQISMPAAALPSSSSNVSGPNFFSAADTATQNDSHQPVSGELFGGVTVTRGLRPAQFGVSGRGANASFWYRGFDNASSTLAEWMQVASTAYVQAAIAQLVGSSPAALDTLNELAAALGDDPNFASTMTTQLAGKAALAGSVNQQFSVKDASVDGHAVNRGQLNTGLAGKAALAGSTTQKFWVLSSPGDNNAAVPVSLLNSGLAGKVDSSGFTSGSNGNGAWSKIPGGGQWCRQNLSIPAKGNLTWTFPAGFTAAPGVFITGINGDPAVWLTGVGPNNVGLYNNNDAALNVNLLAIW